MSTIPRKKTYMVLAIISLSLIFYSSGEENFTKALPIIEFSSIQEYNDDIYGNSRGDNDGLVEAGETIELRISLNNTGDQDATNVNATISSLDPYVNITTATQSFLTIPSGTTGLSSSYYVFSTNSSCTIGYEIAFTLDIESTEGIWSDSFSIVVVNGSNIEFYGYSISTESNGGVEPDNDNNLDPGENIGFYPYIINTGGAKAYEVTGVLTRKGISLTYVTLIDDTGNFYTIDEEGDRANSFFELTLDGACPDKTVLDFTLTLTDKYNTNWDIDFTITVNGEPSIELVTIEFFEYEGDGDEFMDVGEEWYPEITLRNNGTGYSENIYVLFTSEDPYIVFDYETLSSRNISFGTLWVGEIDDYYSTYYWGFTILNTIPVNHTLTFNFLMSGTLIQPQDFETEQIIKGTTDYQIVDTQFIEYDGNEDEYIDTGETWYFALTIQNVGEANGQYLQVLIDSTDKHIGFEYELGYRYTSFGDIDVGENVTDSDTYWRFTILSSAPEDYSCNIKAILSDETEQEWEYDINTTVTKISQFELTSVEFVNSYAEDDEHIDAGETWYVKVALSNIGEGWGKNLFLLVETDDKYIEFYYSQEYRNISIGDLKSGETGNYSDTYYWRFSVSKKAPRKHEINFSFILSDEKDNSIAVFKKKIELKNGRITIFGLPVSGTALFFILVGLVSIVGYPLYYYRNTGRNPLSRMIDKIKRSRKKRQEKRKTRLKEKQAQKQLEQQEKERLRQEKERKMLKAIKENEVVLLEKFKDILEMTQAVPIKDVAKSLGLKKEQLFEKLLDWNDNLEFKIKEDMIIVEDIGIFRNEMNGFIQQLDEEFKEWEDKMKTSKTKKK